MTPKHILTTAISISFALAATHTAMARPASLTDPEPATETDSATRHIVVVDAETGQRIRGAIIGCDAWRDTTAWDGTATLPKHFAQATIYHTGYLTRHISAPLSSDTLCLIPSAHRLAEVEVWGRHMKKDMLQRTPDRRLAEQLIANEGRARGFNPLGLVAWGVKRLLPRHPKLTKREKQKIVMDNY